MLAGLRKSKYFCSTMRSNLARHIGQGADGAPVVMGILNCTPDSFFEGSRKQTVYEIAQRADEIVSQGGRIIDIGAFSTRPGAQVVSLEEEMQRMRVALNVVRPHHPDAILSIDTYRPEVARMAVEEFGANIINDVSEGGITGVVDQPLDEYATEDDVPLIFREMARLKVPYILMSVQPDIERMIANFRKEVAQLQSLGVEDIILDPGFGFGKEVLRGNFGLLSEMPRLKKEFPTLPLLVGISRKRMVWQLLGGSAQDDTALRGTMLLNILALERGADILRVHDVKDAVDTVKVFMELNH